MVKPHGFVLDFVGIFDKLEKALAFDSAEINAIVKDIGLLKSLFAAKMGDKVPGWLKLIVHHFNDKDVDGLIEHFRDKEWRKEFFKEYGPLCGSAECEVISEQEELGGNGAQTPRQRTAARRHSHLGRACMPLAVDADRSDEKSRSPVRRAAF